LADFLTREGLLPGDFEKFNLKDLTIDDFYDQLPKTNFTLMEWICQATKELRGCWPTVNHITSKTCIPLQEILSVVAGHVF
jgi:hypothetical protein